MISEDSKGAVNTGDGGLFSWPFEEALLFDWVKCDFAVFYHNAKIVDACLFKMALGCLEEEGLVRKSFEYHVDNCPVQIDILQGFVWGGDQKIVHVDEDIGWPFI